MDDEEVEEEGESDEGEGDDGSDSELVDDSENAGYKQLLKTIF